ncbi:MULTISPECIES: hypothetical protein [unclassified Enterococcus]|uniref:hypothetical protein n=1 Tax=unclassified Enterococcus TaxID=2608891 RepID=UPI00155468D2|nr:MULTISPECIES: hypothetical protein [unclassified Enterococcus]MBS7577622.1 hypothetical protein [Enterococcus sp. MMGLQ5-2]MBS7584184.1 hypothetical protein [Enterococcus sp. MMGLQ5-1]NPD12042.1 hypothetical protein [Enterococcus sp. MMGLQ5-1]NPD37455.1 hypothetical protein [Enterococcus sp. MMGLQ5-2]
MHVLDLAPTYKGNLQDFDFARKITGYSLAQSFVKKLVEDKDMDYHNEHDSELAMFAVLAVSKLMEDMFMQDRIKLNVEEKEYLQLMKCNISDSDLHKLPLKVKHNKMVGRLVSLCIDKYGEREGRVISSNTYTKYLNEQKGKEYICKMLEKEIFKMNGTFKSEVLA